MLFLHLFSAYLLWHYTAAFLDWWRLYANASWFLFNFFSIRILFRTFFATWKRLRESGKAEGGMLGAIIINPLTRLFGMLARTVVISAGFISLVFLSFCFLAALALWVAAPILLLAIFVQGIRWFSYAL